MQQTITYIVQLAVLVFIGYLIWRYGKLRIVTHIGYVYRRRGHELNISYRKFDGFEYYYFRLHRDESLTLAYDVTVEEGSLCLEWRDRKGLLFSKTFSVDEQGTFDFSPKLRLHSLKVIGENTRGGCKVKLINRQ